MQKPVLKNRSSQYKSDWCEIVSRKDAFQHIMMVLNRYYLQTEGHDKDTIDPSRQFRLDLVKANTDNLKIFIKKFSNYEYLVYSELDKGEEIRTDYWVHIDGIQQERDELASNGGQENHPVFSIYCMSDLYDNNTAPANLDIEEELKL